MHIRGFSDLFTESLRPILLKDCSVVIDGLSLYNSMYENSKLPYIFGPNCDSFAVYFKEQLEMFKRANLKCHILFGDCQDHKAYLLKRTHIGGNYLRCFNEPLLIEDTVLQILNEMNFDYTIIYTKNIVEDCVALANRLKCPIIGCNIQYCFLSAPYIPLKPGTQFEFDENDSIKCDIFKRQKFLNDLKITINKLIIFVLLSDTDIFDRNTFNDFLVAVKISATLNTRNKYLINWLRSRHEDVIMQNIFTYISDTDRTKFLTVQTGLRNRMLCESKNNLAVLYFTDKNKVKIHDLDTNWFEKGVCLRHVNKRYINIYYFKVIEDNCFVGRYGFNISIILSIDIIKYGYDLLTNFNGGEILVRDEEKSETMLVYSQSVQKPNYDAVSSVFENGWDNIRSLKLFEHFLIEALQGMSFDPLENAPADSRILIIALVYLTRKESIDITSEIYSILLSYVMLNVVNDKSTDPKEVFNVRPILDYTSNKDLVLKEDCDIASFIMKEYFTVNDRERKNIKDIKKFFLPLVQFQYCLQELNNLNTLCGSPYDSCVYAKTYNATFVNNFLWAMKTQDDKDYMRFITEKLNPAATVLAFFNGLLLVYEKILYEY